MSNASLLDGTVLAKLVELDGVLGGNFPNDFCILCQLQRTSMDERNVGKSPTVLVGLLVYCRRGGGCLGNGATSQRTHSIGSFSRRCLSLQSSVSMEELKKTTWKDFMPIVMTALKVMGGLVILGTGNILLAGIAYYMYRNYSNKAATAEKK